MPKRAVRLQASFGALRRNGKVHQDRVLPVLKGDFTSTRIICRCASLVNVEPSGPDLSLG